MENCCPQEGDFTKKTKGLCIPDLSLGKVQGLRVPRKNRELDRTGQGCLIMNERNLLILCQNDGLYEFPLMNKKLYLHFKVISSISSLQKYTNLKCLYLQNNVIRKIQNLDHLTQLENLFLQNNMISQIEGLSKLKELKILNLANNTIFAISGLAQCTALQSLTLTHNYLADFMSIEHLGQCSNTLTSIDLAENKIGPDQRMFDLIPQVKVLYLSGNPIVRETNHYRRTVVARLPALMYLDQRGVDPEQRMLAESWLNEGEAGFKAAKVKIMTLRKQKKEEARKQIMANIDVHRRNKINVFEGNILDFEKEIQKLRGYMREPGNEDQIYFYESRIADLMQKMRENQEFIDSIYKRMGCEPLPPVYSIQLAPEKNEEVQTHEEIREGGMFDIREESEDREEIQSQGQSQGHSETNSQAASLQSGQSAVPSQESGTSGRQQSTSSQPSSLQTYNSFDELD